MGEGDEDVGEDDGGVGVDCGDDDGPRRRSSTTGSEGERAPSFSFFLGLLPRWEKGFPSGPWSPWRGRCESPSDIGYVSLSPSVSAFWILPFHRFFYNRRSVTPIGLKFEHDFIRILAFLRRKKGNNRLTGGPRGSEARPGGGARPLPRAPLGHRLALILLPIFPKYSKNILCSFLSRLDSV